MSNKSVNFSSTVLVAEDNPVNQIIAREMLAELGCDVTIAENGKIAFDLLCKQSFDLVLMDIQMPEMDGCEATHAIRQYETEQQATPSTIIAVTANAMPGDRERFISEGMDDYICKPFGKNDLAEILTKWLAQNLQKQIAEQEPTPKSSASSAPIDEIIFENFKARYKGKRTEKLINLLEIFEQSTISNLDEILVAKNSNDFQQIKYNAHTMKSSCAYFGALQLVDHYKSLEVAATEENENSVHQLIDQISHETERVNLELHKLIRHSNKKLTLTKTELDHASNDQPHILLVDDDDIARQIAADTLENNGFKVTEAQNGKDGIRLFEECRPDLVLMDVEMPFMNGYEACEIIRESSVNDYVPVVMVTGNEDQKSVDQCYASGAADFESKPVNWSILLPRLKFILRSAENMRKLELSEKRLNNAQQIGNIGHWDLNLVSDELYLSDQLHKILGLVDAYESLSLKSFLKITDTKNRKLIRRNINKAINEKISFSFDHEILLPNGTFRILQQEGEASYDSLGKAQTIHAVVQDVTERRESEKIIAHQAYHDSLTGLSNRKSFNDQLEFALNLSKRNEMQIAVLYLDIDGFKRINDSLGHHIGDKLLKEISERLLHTVRESDRVYISAQHDNFQDTTVARLGGDEFTVMLTNVQSKADIEVVSQRICQAFSVPFHIIDGDEKYDLHVTTSIGICLTENHSISAETLQKHADIAMYHSKKAGKNTYRFYSDTMNVRSDGCLEMETKLRGAIENNELKLYYQPKIDIVSGELIGMEALLRWFSPDLGFVSPVDFIPLSEESGLILPISNWVLEAACRQNKAWQDAGYKPVSVAGEFK